MARWQILIATLGRRRDKLAELLGILMPQVDAAGGAVTVEALWNNRERPIGQVREEMLRSATGDYINFIDDDDIVAGNYVARVLPLLDGVDYIGWRAQLTRHGGGWLPPVYHTLRFSDWHNEDTMLCRDITHFNPMRRDLAVTSTFLGAHEDFSEDFAWAALRGRVKTEHFIDEIMYFQRWHPSETTDAHYGKDPGSATYTRVAAGSPHFSWHPGSSPEGQ